MNTQKTPVMILLVLCAGALCALGYFLFMDSKPLLDNYPVLASLVAMALFALTAVVDGR